MAEVAGKRRNVAGMRAREGDDAVSSQIPGSPTDTSYRYNGLTVHPQSCGCPMCFRPQVQPYPVPVAGGWAYVCGGGHTHTTEEAAGRCGR